LRPLRSRIFDIDMVGMGKDDAIVRTDGTLGGGNKGKVSAVIQAYKDPNWALFDSRRVKKEARSEHKEEKTAARAEVFEINLGKYSMY